MATIRDVAQRAGVSISTVSRVLNGYPLISEDAKQSVFAAVKDLNYSPNTRGRGSQRSNNNTIFVVSTSPKPEICSGICDAARDMGYGTLLTNTPPNALGAYTKYVEDGLVSGIILLNIRLLAEFSDSLPASCPIVQCNEYENVPRANLVTIDNNGATREITDHLIGIGKRRIAFMSPEYAFGYPIKFAVDREYGFRQALEEHGIEINPDFLIRSDYAAFSSNNQDLIKEMNASAERLLSLPASKRPDGIVCTNDIMAACCVNTAKKLGIKIPEELAVTAFDNSMTCLLTMPEITSIAQPYYEMGYESAKLLISAIEEKPSITKRVLLDHSMVIRGSTVIKKQDTKANS